MVAHIKVRPEVPCYLLSVDVEKKVSAEREIRWMPYPSCSDARYADDSAMEDVANKDTYLLNLS
eukprot:9099275-Prorocentrum_lima.AAC.1